MSPAALGHLAMFTFSALVAGSFSLGVRAAPLIDPVAMNVARFVLGAVVVGAVGLATRGISGRDMRAPWRYLVLGGTFATYFVLMFEGMRTSDPVATSAVFTLTPIMSAGFGWLLLRQRTTPRMAMALAIGGAGALWVIFRADWSALVQFHIGEGELIYFYGCIAHAIYIPLVRMLNRGESAIAFAFFTLVAGALLMSLYGGGRVVATDWAALPGIVWIALGYLTVATTAVTFTLVQFGSMRLPAGKVMAYNYLTPSWVIGWEIALGGDVPPLLVLGGVGLSIVALLLLLRNEH
ncbi:DMT family transporter [Mesobacterium pallidum]|uniref:DMT family transporter n=1 Tax=Mesobacterium pallidum TaxID=2872037 RepID=UPI002342F92F|nr:DMT family transporter [Mesobacterium pallidum]